MANSSLIPLVLKPIQPYIKIAEEHDKRDPSISYWCRLYAVQTGLKLNDKSPECSAFFTNLMNTLEKTKKERLTDEAVTNEVVAQAHIENYALKLFVWADNQDRASVFNKNVVKAFYTSGFIYDVASTFGEPSEEVQHHKKYAKWKATYIHNCLKNGETPIAGPMAMEGEGDDQFAPETSATGSSDPGSSNSQTPYPIGFNVPSSGNPSGGLFNPATPGLHAPPSTPNVGVGTVPTASNEEEEGETEGLKFRTLKSQFI